MAHNTHMEYKCETCGWHKKPKWARPKPKLEYKLDWNPKKPQPTKTLPK